MDGSKTLTSILNGVSTGRRGFLKIIAAAGASAIAVGCSKGDGGEFYSSALEQKHELAFDNDVKNYWSTGPHNCGMRCKHKLFVKNGRVTKMTSDGDVLRADSQKLDEDVADPQKRACVRGYSYIKRQYQPDRLKYPLLQTKSRGDLTGFKRISWSEAIDRLADMMNEMIQRKTVLKYLPIRCFWNVPSLLKKPDASNPIGQGPCFAVYGNASFGNIAGALWDAVGYDSAYNSSVDMLNSKFILSWAVDTTTSFGHQGHSFWFYTKAKEAGVPIVIIEAQYSDAAASMATGTTLTYNKNGRTFIDYTIPGVVLVRPGTDCALAAAMCYVIWKNKEYDETFLKDKCFGFFTGDQCTNESTDPTQSIMTTPPADLAYSTQLKMSNSNYYDPRAHIDAANEFVVNKTPSPLLGNEGALFANPWKGKSFTVPQGESFEEYMQSLEAQHGGYAKVLEWSSNVTGVAADLIEALALKYATAKPARLDGGGGPQRTFDGMFYSWFTIALAAMTGNSDKQGGGPGYSMMNEAGAYTFHQAYFSGGGNRLNPFKNVLISIDNWADVILTGRDERTRQQVIEDMLIFHNINLTEKQVSEKLLEIDMMISCANHLITMPNVNKNIYAVTKKKDSNPSEYEVKYNVTVDHFMTPTAAYSDLVLPCTTHWEQADGIGLYTMSDLFMMQQALEPMFEAKSDAQIWYEVAKKLPNIDQTKNTPPVSGVGNPYADGTAKYLYDNVFKLNPTCKDAVNPEWVQPDYDELKMKGRVNLPVPQDKAIIGLKTISPIGSLSTSTGRINFYSPFYGEVRPGRTLAAGPRYIDKTSYKYYDGYERMLDASGNFVGWQSPESGRQYKLQVLTDKSKSRAHTAFDNVAMIKDKFPQTCKMNPIDAEARGIKDGEMVYVYNDRGCMYIPAELTHAAIPGVIRIQHGSWYRAHPTDTVKAWLMLDKSTDTYTEVTVPIDVGGCENILTLDRQTGANDPFIGGSIYVQGNLCEVSKVKPE